MQTKDMPIHRVNMVFNNVAEEICQQYNLFVNPAQLDRERKVQKAMPDIQKKYGKNAVLKGMSLDEGGTAMERNRQIGGHKA